jgi:hypothetical protein
MSSVERGLRNISVLNLARIATALDVSVWELLGVDEGARTAAPPRTLGPRTASDPEWKPGHYLSLG